MNGGVRLSLAGLAMLLAVAGCGRSFLQYGAERASWRHQAEVACLKSGAVKIGTGVVQIEPIEGPGMCGAAFPLKVVALGESTAMSYGEAPRPPGTIPRASSAQMPRWPAGEPRTAPPVHVQPIQVRPMQAPPVNGQQMRWVTGAPPAIEAPEAAAPGGRPMSINAPGVAMPDDIPDDAILPDGRTPHTAPRTQPAYYAPVYQPPRDQEPRELPRLGPMRGPNAAANPPAVLKPAATLACPIVSALDRWVAEGVQPAALHWFGSPVVEIKQISGYSCRGMVGAGTSRISEHAFGNALDIAGFTLADGRKISVRDHWRGGTPEEQAFLHDVQLFACQTFNTVLSPGYNAAHYNHIHVDLMRRQNGRRPCRPSAIPGEVVAAKARAVYASKQRGRDYTGSVTTSRKPVTLGGLIQEALAGEDGYVADEDGDGQGDAVTGSIPEPTEPPETSSSGSIFSRWFGSAASPARKNAVPAFDRNAIVY